MSWVKLESRYPGHPKIWAAGVEAMALDIAGICHAREYGTDGLVLDADLVRLLPAPAVKIRKWAARLVDVGRWEVAADLGGWLVHDFAAYNPAGDGDAARSERARDAARARWQKQRSATARGSPADARAAPPGDAKRMRDAYAKRMPDAYAEPMRVADAEPMRLAHAPYPGFSSNDSPPTPPLGSEPEWGKNLSDEEKQPTSSTYVPPLLDKLARLKGRATT